MIFNAADLELPKGQFEGPPEIKWTKIRDSLKSEFFYCMRASSPPLGNGDGILCLNSELQRRLLYSSSVCWEDFFISYWAMTFKHTLARKELENLM
jgi:hypothetical protein